MITENGKRKTENWIRCLLSVFRFLNGFVHTPSYSKAKPCKSAKREGTPPRRTQRQRSHMGFAHMASYQKENIMQKEFFIYSFLLITLIAITLLHYFSFDRAKVNSSLQSLAKLTQIAEPSLQSGALEGRFLYLQRSINNTVYPDMLNVDKSGFVYAK